MTSNARPDAFLRGLRRLLASVLLPLLAACAPGSGGTGTGPVNLFFATVVTTTPGVGGNMGAVQLHLQDASVRLDTACGRFVFEGDWSAGAGPVVVLPGRLETAAQSAPAMLQLQFSAGVPDSPRVTVTLFDAAGAVLLGPLPLDREAGPLTAPPVGSCG